MKKIFISHASADQPIIKSLIDDLLHGALSVKISDIFCTTADGTKIESGKDWRNSIQEALRNSKVTLLIITPNYKESEICMCEMGAAWVTSSKVLPFIVEPITYDSVGVIQQPKQIEKILEEKSLDRLRDVIQETLEIDPKEIKSDRWTAKKTEFLQKVKMHLKTNPFPKLFCPEWNWTNGLLKLVSQSIKEVYHEKHQKALFSPRKSGSFATPFIGQNPTL